MHNKEADILRQMAKISEAERQGSYEQIRRDLSVKRSEWLETNMHLLGEIEGSDLRKAYEMILIRYIGIDPREVPVIKEDDRKIVWHSYNWCPVLEACKRLNVDTRKVCKEGWEESIEEMAQMINPKIRFLRNYSSLRPHGEYCEEIFELCE